MNNEYNKVTDEISVSDIVRKCFSAYELKDRRIIEDLLSDDFTFTSLLRKLMDDRLKALHDKDINALLSNHTPDILSILQGRGYCTSKRSATANNVIDPQPYIGADTVIAREMDDIITFASPRNQTAQLSVVHPVRASVPSGNRSGAPCHTHSLS